MAQRRIKGLAIHRPIVYGNTATLVAASERLIPEHTHRWTVAVRSAASPPPGKRGEVQQIGGYDDIGYFVKKVSFKLHETYANPIRVIEKPPFEVTETGWGEFEIQIKIFFVSESNEKSLTVMHLLKLHPWTIRDGSIVPDAPQLAEGGSSSLDVSSVHSWQYDEVVFFDPTEALYNIMMANPPTPLPKGPRNQHQGNPTPICPHNGGAFGELSIETEEKEGERILAAKNKIVAELEEHRAKLIAYEAQIKQLKEGL